MKVGIIVASVRDTRKGIHIAKWVYEQSKGYKADFDLVDLKDMNLPHMNEPVVPKFADEYKYEATRHWSKVVKSYDGFIFVTPEYNGYPPGSLKDAIDFLFQEWENKPFGIVGYGGRGAEWSADHLATILERFSMKKQGFVGIHKPEKAYPDNEHMDESYIEGDLDALFKSFE